MYVVPTADTGDLDALRDAARDGRAAAMSRRRALAAGKSALAPASAERVRTGFRETELRAPAAAADARPPADPDGQGAPSAQGAPAAAAVATDDVAAAHLGRALSKERRRQMSQGKQALNGGDRTAATAGADGPAFFVHRGGAR